MFPSIHDATNMPLRNMDGHTSVKIYIFTIYIIHVCWSRNRMLRMRRRGAELGCQTWPNSAAEHRQNAQEEED